MGATTEVFFAIYDGHLGRGAARFAARNLHEILRAHLEQGEDYVQATTATFLEIDRLMAEARVEGGTTAVIVLIDQRKLVVANVGDSRAILDRGGQALRLSRDHKPDTPEERERIEGFRGRISDSNIKTIGAMALSRVLGNKSRHLVSEVLSAEPHIEERDLDGQDRRLILACDGVWDEVDDQEAVDVIKEIEDPQEASRKLLRTARKKGSTDNISIIVVNLSQLAFHTLPLAGI